MPMKRGFREIRHSMNIVREVRERYILRFTLCLLVFQHKLQMELKLQLGVERPLPKFNTFGEKNTDRCS